MVTTRTPTPILSHIDDDGDDDFNKSMQWSDTNKGKNWREYLSFKIVARATHKHKSASVRMSSIEWIERYGTNETIQHVQVHSSSTSPTSSSCGVKEWIIYLDYR